jgi:hypothetical protein
LVVPTFALVVYAVVFTVAAGLLLQFRTVDIHFASAKKVLSEEDAYAGEKVMHAQNDGTKDVTRLDVDLINYGLELHKRSLWGPGRKLRVLKGVNTRFEAGKLNVILGRAYLHYCFHLGIKIRSKYSFWKWQIIFAEFDVAEIIFIAIYELPVLWLDAIQWNQT